MNTRVDTDTRRHEPRPRSVRYRPPYGPIEAILGYVLFYVLIDRATPTIVAGAGEVFPDVAPSTVGFVLAALLWFVFTISALDQLRRQSAALGVGSHDQVDPDPATRNPPSEPLALAALVGLVVGGGVAWLTFEPGLSAFVAVVDAMVPFDAGSVMVVDAVVLVAFFVSYGVATWSLDRLAVGGLRWALSD